MTHRKPLNRCLLCFSPDMIHTILSILHIFAFVQFLGRQIMVWNLQLLHNSNYWLLILWLSGRGTSNPFNSHRALTKLCSCLSSFAKNVCTFSLIWQHHFHSEISIFSLNRPGRNIYLIETDIFQIDVITVPLLQFFFCCLSYAILKVQWITFVFGQDNHVG